MGVADSIELVLAEEEAVAADEGELELIEKLDELRLDRVEDDDNNDDDKDKEEDAGVGLVVDLKELDDVVEKAMLNLDEVEDGEVNETTGLELLDEDVEDMPATDELPRLELDEEAAFRLFQDDELALQYVSKPVIYPERPNIYTCL